ncbi:V-type ATPase subunit a family protein [Ascoidea rubescens DSM 1968]|uniref:V-type proton ATPase subunit a n=1 Tax=Ascoidea rubescens DSM 1968 TaxID=1344418 RepID=A0A1D2VLM4_9ASCO|nr:subunit A of vacuolar-ATPase V0 domain [Ascoidea rubescens DSM 1968]ODV62501.1 subunit A of vacuolar-ATPase V0 domain [Ascoidea rubescens DSM 1968]
MNTQESIFRSADMSLIQIYVAAEIVRDVIAAFGSMSNVQFRDLNKNISSFQRNYVNEIRRFDNTQRQLRYLYKIINDQHLAINLNYQLIDSNINLNNNNESENNNENEIQNESIIGNIYDPIDFDPTTQNKIQYSPPLKSSKIDQLIELISHYELKINDLSTNLRNLSQKKYNLIENRHVLLISNNFFSRQSQLNQNNNIDNRFSIDSSHHDNSPLLVEEQSIHLDFPTNHIPNNDSNIIENAIINSNPLPAIDFIIGTIERDKIDKVQTILWRTLRGNLFFNHIPIDDPIVDESTNENILKDVFIIYTHGKNLINITKKVLISLNAKVFNINNNYQNDFNDNNYQNDLNTLNSKLDDLNQVLDQTQQTLNLELSLISDKIYYWSILIKMEKSIFITMNKFDFDNSRHTLIAEGWVPTYDIQLLKNALRDITDRASLSNMDPINTSQTVAVVNVLKTNRTPPTFHKTNKFTQVFQNLCDSYGIATYREVNPGLPTIATFPFIFALMFGDLGHGFILMLVGLYLIINELKFSKIKKDDMFDMIYSGRYLIFLMGVFSMFTGLVYNDIFSIPMTLFKSGWEWPKDFNPGDSIEATQNPNHPVYFLGIDSAWHGTDNALLFLNSYKMKLSILIGFIHMLYSLCFSCVNYKFFNSKIDLIGNFIPSILFMSSIFGYLCITIVYKWCVDWYKINKPPPSLLNMLINMFLSPGTIDEELYPGQAFVQVFLLLVALICVPWLLLYKPMALRSKHNAAVNSGYTSLHEAELEDFSNRIQDNISVSNSQFVIVDYEDNSDGEVDVDYRINTEITTGLSEESQQKNFDFGDIMIHQVIHTIEFCLNCVSHTASYLRLWALSLAHSQLSTVLWGMTISSAFSVSKTSFGTVIFAFFMFAMWFVLSVCVLVIMEGTSAMLHALRLHWIESMSKFFQGEGYAYEPFSFKQVIEDGDDDI